MNSEKVKQALDIYIDKDNINENINHIFSQKNYYIATNGFTMVMIHFEFADKLLDAPFQETPNVFSVLPDLYNLVPYKISIEALKSEMVVDLVDEIKNEEQACSECNGRKFAECSCCGQDAECQNCDGTGTEIIDVPTGNKIPNPIARLEWNGVVFMYEKLIKLVNICNILELEHINYCHSKQDGPNIFESDDKSIIIVIMPMRNSDNQPTKKINLKT
jgi:hypothetical protein